MLVREFIAFFASIPLLKESRYCLKIELCGYISDYGHPPKIYIRATPSTNWCKLFSWPLRPLTCIKGYYHKHQPHGTWRKRMATEGWNDDHWLIVAFNDQPYRFLEVFHIIHIWKMICISRLGWQGDCCSHELKTQWLHFDWFISFNILLTISLLSIIFPSDLTLWYH